MYSVELSTASCGQTHQTNLLQSSFCGLVELSRLQLVLQLTNHGSEKLWLLHEEHPNRWKERLHEAHDGEGGECGAQDEVEGSVL